MFHTSDDEIESIALKEGFRAKAHNSWGRWEIGYGQENALFPGTAGEITVTEGLEIDRKTAMDALKFFVYNVVDPLVTEHFNPQTQAERFDPDGAYRNRWLDPESEGARAYAATLPSADGITCAAQALCQKKG